VIARFRLFQQTLIFGLLPVLLLASCKPAREPTATAEAPTAPATVPAVPAPSVTPASIQVPSPTPSALPSPSTTPTTHPTATEPPAATIAASPTLTLSPQALAIEAFSVDAEDVETGKRLTFHWKTTGANRVHILSGTAQRLAPSWEVAPEGTLTVELSSTNYRNPSMTLVAQYESAPLVVEQAVSRSVTVEWECPYTYFFEPGPAVCPFEEAISTWAAEQVFERGRMLWFQEVRFGNIIEGNLLFVLYDDGQWQWLVDTWTPDQPESDPTIVPPEGRFQPVRGFGKAWRDHPQVRERIGWGLAPEQGYYADWQTPFREVPPGAAYIRTFTDGVIEMAGWQSGTWQFVAP
jgi:hypothetical protein